MFVNDIFKKKQLNEGGFDIPEIPRAPQPKPAPNKDKTVDEAGPFSYGAKKPRRGSVADLAAKKRQEQEKGKQPIEPRDLMAGTAKVTKGVAEGEVLQFPKSPQDKNVRAKLEQRLLAAFNQIVDYADDNGIDILEKNAPLYSKLFGKYDTEDATLDPEQAMARNEPIEVVAQVVKEVEHIAKHIDEYLDNMWGNTFNESSVDEGFDDLDRFMKDKYGPKPSGGSGIKHGTYGQPGRQRGRKKGELSGAFHQGGGSDIPHNVDFDRSHSERSAGRRMPRFSDDYDSVKRSEVDEGSVQDKLHKRHQELRKKRGAPDPEYYQELKKTFDLPDDERQARTAELKQKYKITNEDRERYIEALGRAGYEIVNERRMTCPECGGAAYSDQMLAEKQDACYHKVKSRYKVWPSAYASGALVRCRKKGAKNWGNKSKK